MEVLLLIAFLIFVSEATARKKERMKEQPPTWKEQAPTLTRDERRLLHEHGEFGWHSHPYEGHHRHFGNHLSGPFYYPDE